MEWLSKYYQFAMIPFMIVFGAISHAFVQWKLARDGKLNSFDVIDFFILLFIACFAGIISAAVAYTFFEDNIILVGAFGGGGGFLGLQGLNKVSQIMIDVFAKKLGK